MTGSLASISDFAVAFHKGSKRFWSSRTLPPGGTGPYAPASYLTHPTLKKHTIYTPHPRSLRPDQRLPVLVWANGLGLAWGLMFGHFLQEIASHGYVVLATGEPGEADGGVAARVGRLGHADETAMVAAVRWAVEDCGGCQDPDDVRAHVDGTRIALGGQSKGGQHAYAAAAAVRDCAAVRTVGLFNAGLFVRTATATAQVGGLRVPVFYVLGGAADVAFKHAQHDWDALLPRDLPAWWGHLDAVGHLGTFYDDDDRGGRFATVALDWLAAMLKGDELAMRNLLEGCGGDGWEVRYRNL